jgi:two-component system NtrC family response regulator
MARVLVVDDDPLIRSTMQRVVLGMGHQPVAAATLTEGLELMRAAGADVVCLDVALPDGNGLQALPLFKEFPEQPEIVIITGTSGAAGAELALRNGAWDFIQKPANLQALKLTLCRALEYREVKQQRQKHQNDFAAPDLVAAGSAMQRCLKAAAAAAGTLANVLVWGETGTGKELLARAIHRNSSVARGAFVVVDCAALPGSLVESVLFGHARGAFTGADQQRDGLVLQAHQGTLFLDEVGEMSLDLQKAFLRVLQERRFRPVGAEKEERSEFRLIAATNRDLEALAEQGGFRPDLLHRLNTMALHVPPLRERTEDIPELARHYVDHFCRRYGLAPKQLSGDFLDALAVYPWPGNVRELVNVVERLVVTAEDVPMFYSQHLPLKVRVQALQERECAKARTTLDARADLPPWKEHKALCEQDYFQRLLQATGHDLDAAAAISGISVKSLYRYLKRNDIPTRN